MTRLGLQDGDIDDPDDDDDDDWGDDDDDEEEDEDDEEVETWQVCGRAQSALYRPLTSFLETA